MEAIAAGLEMICSLIIDLDDHHILVFVSDDGRLYDRRRDIVISRPDALVLWLFAASGSD